MRRPVLVAALSAIALLAACGGDEGEDSPPIVIRTPTQPATPAGETPTGDTTATEPAGETPGTPVETPSIEPPTPPPPTNGGGPRATPTPDPSIVVACGDPLAPLDKQHRLPADCVPGGLVYLPDAYVWGEGQLLVSDAADAMIRLIDAAANDGIFIYVTSSYRSYDHQVSTYNWHVANYGQEYADRVSARPGHSEHQLGTTADVINEAAGGVLENFPGTPEAAWVEANAVRFGFVISYPAGREGTTGYAYEPWHLRYVGEGIAADVAGSGLTLGEYLGGR